MKPVFVTSLAIVGTMLFFVTAGSGQTTSLENRVIELEQRLSELERKVGGLTSPESSEKVVFSKEWKNKTNWKNLQPGMTREQVRQLMGGEPDMIFRYATGQENWRFGSSVSGGEISFSNGQVDGWTEP